MHTSLLLPRVLLAVPLLLTLSPAHAQSIPSGCLACATTLELPATPVSLNVTSNDRSLPAATAGLVTAVVTGSPLNSALVDGTYQMWCGDSPASPIRSSQFTPYSTYSPTLPPASQNPNWNKVNWILNNKQGTVGDVQEAIWRVLTGGGQTQTPSAITLSLVANADANFVPAPGQKQAVAMYKDGIGAAGFGATQDLIVELPVPDCGTIGNFVWVDSNSDGIQNDSPSSGINGVTLELRTMTNVLVATTVTANAPPPSNEPGWYQFPIKFVGPSCSQWQVIIVQSTVPANLQPTVTGAGTTATDSNTSPTVVESSSTRDGSGQTYDFGFKSACTSKIGDYVFQDGNRNGIQDAGDLPVGGVVLQLKDSLGNQVGGLKTTNGQGAYEFSNLCAGTYTVTVVSGVPSGFTATPSLVGSDRNIDSNGSPATVVLPDNFNDDTVDFGYQAPCSGSIGNLVWQDSNRNGVQDLGSEPGIDGVLVTLMQGSTVVGTRTTAGGGLYSFSGLCGGTYTVSYSGAPAGFTPTATGAGTPSTDSNPNPSTVVLPNDGSDQTIDFGLIPPCNSVIGNFVWYDTNANGIQDANEIPLGGVRVNLRDTANNLLQHTTTTAGGIYSFTVCPGQTYVVEVTSPSNTTAANKSPKLGLQPTLTNQGADRGKDSNANFFSVNVPLAGDLTIDFGFRGRGDCTRTPGYWKNHPENWPVDTLILGNITYNKTQLLAILNKDNAKSSDSTIQLAFHLIAAKLNLYAGASVPVSTGGYIFQADQLLAVYPVGSGVKRQDMLNVKDQLDKYNNGNVAGANHCQ